MLGLVIIATVVIIGVLRAVLQLAKQLGGKLLLIVPTAKTVLALSVCGMLAGAVAYAVATMKAKTKNINKQGAASKETNQTQTQKKHFADLLHRVEFDKSVHAKVLEEVVLGSRNQTFLNNNKDTASKARLMPPRSDAAAAAYHDFTNGLKAIGQLHAIPKVDAPGATKQTSQQEEQEDIMLQRSVWLSAYRFKQRLKKRNELHEQGRRNVFLPG